MPSVRLARVHHVVHCERMRFVMTENPESESQHFRKREQRKSFTAQIEREKGLRRLYLVRGTSGERKAWYFVLVDEHKVKQFQKHLKENTGTVQLTAFGSIITSGWGEDPPEDVVQTMSEKYGWS
jgi:hypothetical protein